MCVWEDFSNLQRLLTFVLFLDDSKWIAFLLNFLFVAITVIRFFTSRIEYLWIESRWNDFNPHVRMQCNVKQEPTHHQWIVKMVLVWMNYLWLWCWAMQKMKGKLRTRLLMDLALYIKSLRLMKSSPLLQKSKCGIYRRSTMECKYLKVIIYQQ
jgi:hypothetical protein